MTKILVFSMYLDSTPELNRGRIALIDTDNGGVIGRWVATSGVGTYQDVGDWSKQRGGCLPATYQCNPTFDNYWVHTEPVDRTNVKGIESWAFPITPFSVRTREGVQRSDLMIHLDANVPGSLGCIVMSQEEYTDFYRVFQSECVHMEKVKLFVIYSY